MADSTATTKIVIKHRHTGTVLYEYQPTEDEQASGLAMRVALDAALRMKRQKKAPNPTPPLHPRGWSANTRHPIDRASHLGVMPRAITSASRAGFDVMA